MINETRVGYLTTSVLEEICEREIISSYKLKSYDVMLEYIPKYVELKKYNDGGGNYE